MQMKQELRQIYDDLSIGKLSQKEALERIKELKLKERGAGTEVVSAMPVWQGSGVDAASAHGRPEYSEHQVIACELSAVSARKLESLLPNCRCLSLRTPERKNIAERYSEYAVACFERIQALLRSKPQGRLLVQIVVPSHGEQTLFAGLSGLLKTAALENPLVAGQILLFAPEITSEELAGRLQEEKSGVPDAVVRYEEGTRQVLSWKEVADD